MKIVLIEKLLLLINILLLTVSIVSFISNCNNVLLLLTMIFAMGWLLYMVFDFVMLLFDFIDGPVEAFGNIELLPITRNYELLIGIKYAFCVLTTDAYKIKLKMPYVVMHGDVYFCPIKNGASQLKYYKRSRVVIYDGEFLNKIFVTENTLGRQVLCFVMIIIGLFILYGGLKWHLADVKGYISLGCVFLIVGGVNLIMFRKR